MSKTVIVGLVLLALSIIALLMTGGKSEVTLILTDVKTKASYVYFGFLSIGVVIGLLLHK